MASPRADFWPNVKAFREQGLDPLKWIAGCSVEVEREEVLYPALASIRPALEALGVTIHPREGPDLIDYRGQPPAVNRLLVSAPSHDPRGAPPSARGNPNRAAVILRVFQRTGALPKAFGDFVLRSIEAVPDAAPSSERLRWLNPMVIGNFHAVVTSHESAQFALFDFLEPGPGSAQGTTAVRCETLQVTDATAPPTSDLHVAAASTSALSSLFVLGCHEELTLDPVFDAPDEESCAQLNEHFRRFAADQRLAFRPHPPLGRGKLIIGANVTGSSRNEVPNRHQDVKRGMQVTVTRPFGELAPLAVHLSCLADPDSLARLEADGLELAEVARAARETVKVLTQPARPLGEVIAEFRPPFQEPPELAQHVAATVDLAGHGLIAFTDFASRWELELQIRTIPMDHPEIVSFATRAFLMDNGTACAPGAAALIAWPSVLDVVEQRLRSQGLQSFRIGEVVSRGEASLRVPPSVREVVGATRLLKSMLIDEAA
jgi:selenophosphate synthase